MVVLACWLTPEEACGRVSRWRRQQRGTHILGGCTSTSPVTQKSAACGRPRQPKTAVPGARAGDTSASAEGRRLREREPPGAALPIAHSCGPPGLTVCLITSPKPRKSTTLQVAGAQEGPGAESDPWAPGRFDAGEVARASISAQLWKAANSPPFPRTRSSGQPKPLIAAAAVQFQGPLHAADLTTDQHGGQGGYQGRADVHQDWVRARTLRSGQGCGHQGRAAGGGGGGRSVEGPGRSDGRRLEWLWQPLAPG